ncbi:MAG: hypothetical protein ABIQ12_00850, partial [Opitutaceae bacterium]
MKKYLILTAVLLGVSVFGFAADATATKADAYPLKTCLVSDEPLGGHGDFIAYTHKEAGKPDRLLRFCCDGCIDDFKKEPAKFLAKLDAAEA